MKENKKTNIYKIVSVILVFLGVAAFTGTMWGKLTFGNLAPDQLLINLVTPKSGTSSGILLTLFCGPVLVTIIATVFFSVFAFSKKEKQIKTKLRKILSLCMAIIVFMSGCLYGIKKFELISVGKMYLIDNKFIEENFADPAEVNLSFPKNKRNLIHIYLESMENSYMSTEMGGHMDENLIKPLTDLAKEGVNFSHREKGLGGPVNTTGCEWSVAAMVNMNVGIPMKVPTSMNSYNSIETFLPGAITIGDILASQGYEQTLMLGSKAKFGGLDFFYKGHGNYTILDHDEAIASGKIPKDYYMWWGFEDDKLYEFAKTEITRLYNTGKPFNFVMETADTHFPDGFVSPNTPMTRDNQYANVIAYSASETVKFVRWIQEQPFYENTTIVIIGDHLSMDTNFFKNFDPNYLRTTYNLILNPASSVSEVSEDRTHNRWWSNIDMFPTILASIGVKIEGDRLGLGTNLFSDTPTLFEEHGGIEGWEKVSDIYLEGSKYYAKNILNKSKPLNLKITYY
jgi:phosphoglycerol transferase